MKQRSLKFVQMTLMLALLLSNVSPLAAVQPSVVLASSSHSKSSDDNGTGM